MTTATTEAPKKSVRVGATKANPGKAPNQFVTKEEFGQVVDLMSKLNDKIDGLNVKTATPIEAQEIKDVKNAAPNNSFMNPDWEDKAREILGEALDHCEIFYPKAGGHIFTVVIKDEFSNAPKEYMAIHKTDRRSKELGNDGISGVEIWCRLVKQNLSKKPRVS